MLAPRVKVKALVIQHPGFCGFAIFTSQDILAEVEDDLPII